MQKNIHFVINNDYIEFYVNGECITDCFSQSNDIVELVEELHEFAGVPIYKELDSIRNLKER